LAEAGEYGFRQPVLRFSPTAWAKLLYFRDKSANEVGGFGITKPDDLLSVEDFVTVEQNVSSVTVHFIDESVGQFFDQQVDLGRKPEQFARVWLHTHPGNSPEPSITDEETFKRVFGNCQWSVMAIVAQDNSTYARLSFNTGPGGDILIPTAVDYGVDFDQRSQQLGRGIRSTRPAGGAIGSTDGDGPGCAQLLYRGPK